MKAALVLVLIGLCLAFAPIHAAQGSFDPAALDRFLQDQIGAQRLPGLAVAITQGDQVVYLNGYGSNGRGGDITPETLFHVASITKTFTTLAVMQLVETGQIDLDTPVQTYLPEFTLADADAAARITVRHLLMHTSGMSDAGWQGEHQATIAESVAQLSSARVLTAPGTTYAYHNPNFWVLGRLVEVVSGQPYTDYLRANILMPLGMESTFVGYTAETGDDDPNKAFGHILPFGYALMYDSDARIGLSSGGMVTSAADLSRYLLMLNNGGLVGDAQVITQASLDQMWTHPTLESDYGLGWFVDEAALPSGEVVRHIQHGGDLATYHADISVLPDQRIGIVLLYNANHTLSNLFSFKDIQSGVIALVMGETPTVSDSASTVWRVALFLTILSLIGDVGRLILFARWTRKHEDTSTLALIPGTLVCFVPLLLLVFLPQIGLLLLGRTGSYTDILLSMPEVIFWLVSGTIFGVLRGALRVAFLVRRRQSERELVAA
ncbi:MAG: beta-lactamase family protein [Anaerolinea sp.]|nr:beta-lactamase family protein [Anaerolinea sp.]